MSFDSCRTHPRLHESRLDSSHGGFAPWKMALDPPSPVPHSGDDEDILRKTLGDDFFGTACRRTRHEAQPADAGWSRGLPEGAHASTGPLEKGKERGESLTTDGETFLLEPGGAMSGGANYRDRRCAIVTSAA